MYLVILDNFTFLSVNLFRNVFAAFDANRDGYIDFKEFVLHVGLQESNDVDSKIEFFFKMLVRLNVVI